MSSPSAVHCNDSGSQRLSLFETEIRPSRVLTFIKQAFVSAGVMILFCFWLSGYLVLDAHEFVLIRKGCEDSYMPLSTFGADLMIYLNVLAALIGVCVYASRNLTAPVNDNLVNREDASM